MDSIPPTKRNLVIYSVGVLVASSLGGLLAAGGNEMGGLIFVLSPIAIALLLRFFGGDAWRDAGLSPKLREHWRWYLFALLTYPVTIALVLAAGLWLGITTVNLAWPDFCVALLRGMAVQLAPRLLFAAFEEWGWRGYMEPRLEALGIQSPKRHLVVGLVWGLWHVPLIVSTPYTAVPYALFLPVFVLGCIIQAFVYGRLREASGTVWTAVVLHGIGNTIAWALLQGDLVSVNNKMLANFAPESLFAMLLWGALALLLFRRPGRGRFRVPGERASVGRV